jgi:hypothetical protein
MSARFFTNKSKTLNYQNFNKILIIFSASQSLPWQAGNCPISRYRDQSETILNFAWVRRNSNFIKTKNNIINIKEFFLDMACVIELLSTWVVGRVRKSVRVDRRVLAEINSSA